ncbi:MAG: endo alpha-1,4 polygalactosaminidase [Solirubrobacteraceae bacterium]
MTGLPATSGPYPRPGSAHIWDTDLFQDSNTSSGRVLRIPTGASPVVKAIHAAGHYSICYVEVGAFQTGYPDNSDFAPADYGNRAKRHQMQGYPNEWWFDIAGFKNYVAGKSSTLAGAAVNIAHSLARRFRWCALEGQDAVEPDDLDGYTNASATGAKGGGWGLTKADSAGLSDGLPIGCTLTDSPSSRRMTPPTSVPTLRSSME